MAVFSQQVPRPLAPALALALALALAIALGGACGPGAASEGEAPASSSGSEAVVAGGGEAGPGANCDYGGATRLTCRGDLVCCYPATVDVAYGTCQSECDDG